MQILRAWVRSDAHRATLCSLYQWLAPLMTICHCLGQCSSRFVCCRKAAQRSLPIELLDKEPRLELATRRPDDVLEARGRCCRAEVLDIDHLGHRGRGEARAGWQWAGGEAGQTLSLPGNEFLYLYLYFEANPICYLDFEANPT